MSRYERFLELKITVVILAMCVYVGFAASNSHAATPAHHHKSQHMHKHKRKPHHHKKSTECVLVVNGEKTVTQGECLPVATESQPAPSSSCKQVIEGKEIDLCQPQGIEHSCEHNPLPSECMKPVIENPILICEVVETATGLEALCGKSPEETSPCAIKICELPPKEECPEEKEEVAGPKG